MLLAERPRRGTFVVVGVECARAGAPCASRLGSHFRFAATHIRARFRHDGFEASWMELARADASRFVEALHFTMDAR